MRRSFVLPASTRLQLAAAPDSAHVGHVVLLGLPVAIWSMLLNAFAMSVGFFMLIPLVSVHYTTSLGFTAAAVGLALAVRQFSQQGLMLLTGSLAERVGYRPVLATGMLVRAVGFAGFTVADSLPRLLAASFVAALGGAFFEVSSRSMMAVLIAPEQRTAGFSLWSLASNVGLAIGPVVGSLLIDVSFATVCLVAASCYLVGTAGTLLLIPARSGGASLARPPGLFRTIGTVTRDRSFVVFSAIMTGYYLLATQLFISIPLETERLTGNINNLGLLYLVNSAIAILLQFPLVRLANRHLRPAGTIAVGAGVLAAGLASISLANGLALLLLAVAVMAAARCVVEPVVNTTVAEIATRAGDGYLASYFGFAALSVAFGGAAGQLLGGWLFDLGQANDLPALPWLVLGAIGSGVLVAMLAFARSSAAPASSRRA